MRWRLGEGTTAGRSWHHNGSWEAFVACCYSALAWELAEEAYIEPQIAIN